jgi:DNA-binding beta-propeller fold protein YncE
VSHPRIAVFARSANGNSKPVRVIQGQATKLSRTMHGIAYDSVHDEIVVPVTLAAAVLVFRGGANGEEAPVRVIQGPRTQLIRPHTVCVDEQNGEIIVGDRSSRSIVIFSRTAQGDAAPIRVIRGAKTKLLDILGLAVDPVRNLLVAASTSRIGGTTGLFIFNRTDQGDVAPRAVIAGPNTGILRPWQLAVDPAQGRIFVAVINNDYLPPYRLDEVREGLSPQIEIPSPWSTDNLGFVGVWGIRDNGDVPPRAIIKGPASGLVHPAGVAINPKEGEVVATDSVRNGCFTFLVPEFFRKFAGEMNREKPDH